MNNAPLAPGIVKFDLAAHGTSHESANRILMTGFQLPQPTNTNYYGDGVYFFHGTTAISEACAWARDHCKHEHWIVIGSVIHCEEATCLDLWNSKWWDLYITTLNRLREIATEKEVVRPVTMSDVLTYLRSPGIGVEIQTFVVPNGVMTRNPPTRNDEVCDIVVVYDLATILSSTVIHSKGEQSHGTNN